VRDRFRRHRPSARCCRSTAAFPRPSIIDSDRSAADLAFLSAHDDDPFARYEAMQQLMLDTLVGTVATGAGRPWRGDRGGPQHAAGSQARFGLHRRGGAAAVRQPSSATRWRWSIPRRSTAPARHCAATSARALEAEWRAPMTAPSANRFELFAAAKGARRLRTVALGYIMASGADDAADLAFASSRRSRQHDRPAGRASATGEQHAAERDRRARIFYDRYRDNGLVLDKWFSTQALSHATTRSTGSRSWRASRLHAPTPTGCASLVGACRATS
jgi:aminopeptidase N